MLRFIQDHTYRAVGGTRELNGDYRVQRALLLSDDETLHLNHPVYGSLAAPPETQPVTTGVDAARALGCFNDARDQAMQCSEQHYLKRLMQATAGNVSHAARLAGKKRRILGKLLKKHGIDRAGFDTPPNS